MLIGQLTLNLSLGLYLITQLPQLWHNKNSADLQSLSLSFHGLLLGAYLFDLIYGFSLALPWQYKLVTIVGLACLSIQHYQLYRLHRLAVLSPISFIFFLCLAIALSQFPLPTFSYELAGYLSQLCSISFLIPQILKNQHHQHAKALSLYSILLYCTAMGLDLISAWSLAWPWPSKIGSIANVTLAMIALLQCLVYHFAKSPLLNHDG